MAKKSIFPLICSPGEGVLSFTTGSDQANRLLGKHFPAPARKNWPKQISARLKKKKPFYIIGAPSDCGGGICRGAAHGPIHIRAAWFGKSKKLTQADLGDVPCIPHLLHDSMLKSRQLKQSGRSLWGKKYQSGLPVSPLNLLTEYLVELYKENKNFKPLVLGGDHSISGAVFDALDRIGKTKKLAVLHFDAHTDLLEERYGVENCFATWTAHAVKKISRPAAWVQVGIRASGKNKQHWEKKFGLKQVWAQEARKKDPKKFAQSLIDHWKKLGCTGLYITNDIDGIDSKYAPSTGTPEGAGLTPQWTEAVIRHCSSQMNLVGADLTEVAPVLGSDSDRKKTLQTAVKILSAHNWG